MSSKNEKALVKDAAKTLRHSLGVLFQSRRERKEKNQQAFANKFSAQGLTIGIVRAIETGNFTKLTHPHLRTYLSAVYANKNQQFAIDHKQVYDGLKGIEGLLKVLK
jgi:hypothetical protein